MNVRVRLLGPVDVVEGDDAVQRVSGLRRRAVLAALALSPRQVVSADRLVDLVWGEEPPANARNSLQNHVSYLRGVLGDRSLIQTSPPGYLLSAGADATDAEAAERLITAGERADDLTVRADLLREALTLWRGPALGELADLPWFDGQAQRLEHTRLRARQALAECLLALGENDLAIAELEALCRENPLHEQVHALLMRSLYRAGQAADALAGYDRLRHSLKNDLGIDPSQTLVDLNAAILRQDTSLDLPAGTAGVGSSSVPAPAQLPLALASLAGRRDELSRLDALLASGTTAIFAISGTAGVGKTALAVYWARRVAHRFPDGQMYVNLRGFDPDESVLTPEEAVRGFLHSLGVSGERIPPGLTAQAGMYRSLLAGKRFLVVLDNARDAGQVRPLLPGTPGCAVVVTSRNLLTGLIAVNAAQSLTLDLLAAADALDLLRARLGADRVADERESVDAIVDSCAGLPLALAIAAARAAEHPETSLAALADELREVTGGLEALDGGDPAADVRTVFSWSYRTLSPGAARLFRLLGLHPGPDVNAAAATSLAAVPPRQARVLLGELTRANLLTQHTLGRYAFHDLLRAYAREQAQACEGAQGRTAAMLRMLDYYLHTAHGAALVLHPSRMPIEIAPPRPGVVVDRFADLDAAQAWYTVELPVLWACIGLAAAQRIGGYPWQLAWALRDFLTREGLFDTQIAVEGTAAEAAQCLGDHGGQARALSGLALGLSRLGRFDEADTHFRQALDLFTELDDLVGQGYAHWGLAEVAETRGRPGDAIEHHWHSVEANRATGRRIGEALALDGIGRCHALLGEYQQAVEYCERALVVLTELDYPQGIASTSNSLGHAHLGLGNHEQAVACQSRAVELFAAAGYRLWEARSLVDLGDIHQTTGDRTKAGQAWLRAVGILDELDHPEAAQVRARLGATTAPR